MDITGVVRAVALIIIGTLVLEMDSQAVIPTMRSVLDISDLFEIVFDIISELYVPKIFNFYFL